MAILAHPDDESLGVGGSLARYSAEGVETHVVCATRGERGRYGEGSLKPAPQIVGEKRERELRRAARRLGVSQVHFLDYMDGDLDQASPNEIIGRIVQLLRRHRPDVVLTFGPDGAYGHPDHIAISQFAAAAVHCAADPTFDAADVQHGCTHRVAKLYYMAWPPAKWDAYQAAFKDLKTTIDGVERRATPWPDWMITTRIDTTAYWETVWDAVQCHESQIAIYQGLGELSPAHHEGLWGSQEFYRVFSTVNGGRRQETDLFEGLRAHEPVCAP